MGSLKLASRAARWWPKAPFCSFKERLSIGSVSQPDVLVAVHRKFRAVNSSIAILQSNYHLQPTPRALPLRCHGEHHHPVTARMPTRVNAAQSSSVRRTHLTTSSLNSSASSVSSSTIEPEDVLQFWFQEIDPENNVYADKKWFQGGPDFDKEIEAKFGECLKLAADRALDGWKDSVRGRLALVIIFDQFSRNIYRKSPLAYAKDEEARTITLEMIAQGLDKQLAPMERNFLYLPLMHSENLEDHDVAATVFKGLAAEYSNNEHLHKQLLNTLAFEEKHRAVLEQFGRYPSRNVNLGRPSTPEEMEHLSKGESW